MNAYLCIAKDRPVLQEYIGGWPRYEHIDVVALVFAETRGKAKSIFSRKYSTSFVDFTTIDSVKALAMSVDRPAGIAEVDDPLWCIGDA